MVSAVSDFGALHPSLFCCVRPSSKAHHKKLKQNQKPKILCFVALLDLFRITDLVLLSFRSTVLGSIIVVDDVNPVITQDLVWILRLCSSLAPLHIHRILFLSMKELLLSDTEDTTRI